MKYHIKQLEHLAIDQEMDQTLVVTILDKDVNDEAFWMAKRQGDESIGDDEELLAPEDWTEEQEKVHYAAFQAYLPYLAMREVVKLPFMKWLYEHDVEHTIYSWCNDLNDEAHLEANIQFEDVNQMLLFKLTWAGV